VIDHSCRNGIQVDIAVKVGRDEALAVNEDERADRSHIVKVDCRRPFDALFVDELSPSLYTAGKITKQVLDRRGAFSVNSWVPIICTGLELMRPVCGMREPVTITVSGAVACCATAAVDMLIAAAVAAPRSKADRRLLFILFTGTPLVLS